MASSDLCGKLEIDVEIKASAQQFHDMVWKRPHHIPNASEDKIHGFHLHDGDDWGTVGSIVVLHYTHDGERKWAKDVVEAVDEEKNSITFKVLEGDVMKEYKSFKIHIQATPKSDGQGSIIRWIMEYERLHDAVAHPETLMELAVDLSKDIDAHILSNN
ncbi:hypothetical protein COLO4_13114 [Corchorus olitorius]|uniref:Bet v I/Major latex protein domain-containing protein n=1 Tax=Corchorus olitorius TaxID=93759 RepID=A0A1R3JXY4_9ROSI|nr:hypothetical protein COLO4_13114 [Corchorus olitorius]